ncbi:MAG: site-specific integrase [Raineya sp.]|jgi:hypothetical protein|nr:site-specific integrase [Raineya sp.]
MNTNLSLLFYLKKPKNYVKGEIPIYLRITISGKRAEVSTGRSCEPKRWNASAGRAIGTKEEVRILNNYLNELQKKALETHLQMIQINLPLSATTFRDAFTGKNEKTYFLMEILLEHNERMAALIGNGFAANTLKGYRTTEKHLLAFLKSKLKLVDIDIRQINLEFINNYEFFLRSEMGCSDVSAAKYIKHFRKIVNHCLSNGWITKSPFTNYRNKAKPKEREFLTQSEVERIFNKKFLVPRISQVKDIFLFCCYTGLSYADVRKLKRSEITIGANGKHWFSLKEKKQGLLPEFLFCLLHKS